MFAVVSDLIFSTKITSTAASLGVIVAVVRSLEKLDARMTQGGDRLALIDLDCESIDPIEAIRKIHRSSSRPRMVAFVSHVRADLMEAARQAGVDEVMARSAFVAKLPAILLAASEQASGMKPA